MLLLGYVESRYDDFLYSKVYQNRFSIISTHVDDILQITNARSSKDELHQGLLDAYNSVTYDDKATSYLGMNITRSDDGHIIEVTQSGR